MSYKTNQIIVLSTLVVFASGWLLTGEASLGIHIGGGVFLTWALSREVDPAHELSAFVAAGLFLFSLFFLDSIQLLVGFWLLLLLRAVNRITGKELTLIDVLLLLSFTIFLSFRNENSIYLLIFILALIVLSTFKNLKKIDVLAGILSVLLFIIQSLFMNYLSLNSLDQSHPITWLVIIILSLSFVTFWFISKIKVHDDRGSRVKPSRVLACQLLYIIAVLLMIFTADLTVSDQLLYSSVLLGINSCFFGIEPIKNSYFNQ